MGNASYKRPTKRRAAREHVAQAENMSTFEMHDHTSEDWALAVLLTNDAAVAIVLDELREDDFYTDSRRQVFRVAGQLRAEGASIDAATVCAHLPADQREQVSDYVFHLADLAAVGAHAKDYCASIKNFSAKRRGLRAAGAIREAAMSANGNVSDLPGRLEAITAEAAKEMRERSAHEPAVGGAFVDWSTFWDRDHKEAEWAYPDVLARGRGHAVYAARKMRKSLTMLFIAGEMATGGEPIVVVYLDYEMTEADIFDRLEDMGYGPDSDLSRLRYVLLPTLPPLDTAAGAGALTALVDGVQDEWPDHHLVVVIDTISRAVCGAENDADTFRAFYNCTGIELKRRGITWVRLDHGGKDSTKGQRGSSGKGDDVDVVWKLTSTENGVCFHRDLARMSWVPENVTLKLSDGPLLAYVRLSDDDWPQGTGEVANLLDRLEVPLDASTRDACAKLKTIDEGRRRQVVIAAMRFRRERTETAS